MWCCLCDDLSADKGVASAANDRKDVHSSRTPAPLGQSLYRLIADMENCHPWHLSEPASPDGRILDARIFRYGLPVSDETGPFSISVKNPGQPLKFSFGAFDYLVVEHRLAMQLESIAPSDIELFPATVEGDPSYAIVNVATQIACIDEEQTIGTKWRADDHRPDRIGHYRSINKLVVDPSKVGGHEVFRITGQASFLIVSDTVRQLLEREAGPGLRFITVC